MTVFRLPDLGEGLQEAEIVSWHVSAGDHVVADQPLVSVETEKAVVEIPSPQAGHIAELFVAVGERVPIGTALLSFAETPHTDTGTVVGEIPQASDTTAGPSTPPGRATRQQHLSSSRRTIATKAAPRIRALAKRLNVDLATLSGGGPGGAITAADVERAARVDVPEGYEPLRGARRSMALAMARSQHSVAATTLTEEADIESWSDAARPTVRLIRALVVGCHAAPALNAWYDEDAVAARRHTTVDLGLAVDTEDGLLVPVLRGAEGLEVAGLNDAIADLKTRARQRTLTPRELSDATITLSNFGMLAGLHAALMVVPPQVAILGAGRIVRRVVDQNGGLALHRTLPLSLTFDHRAVTGGDAARFLRAAVRDLEAAD
ncbi:MAG: 2-oxo acid dehydrogenase subunit E2 [Alphaproteobacteria bacterium]|nr:2-oxo acid dehydrogenase subunit E2 [Alphaproteobacteria bacterium]